MTQKTQARSPIMEAVHEAAADLHRHEFIDQRRMRKYELMCLEPVTGYDAQKIRSLRERYQLSQSVVRALPEGGKLWTAVTEGQALGTIYVHDARALWAKGTPGQAARVGQAHGDCRWPGWST